MLHNCAIGDFLIALRVVDHLRRAWGISHVELLGKSSMIQLGRALGVLAGGRDINVQGWHGLFADEVELPAHCRSYLAGFDLRINMLAGPDELISRKLDRLGKAIHVDPKPPADWSRHALQYLTTQLPVSTVDVAAETPFRLGQALMQEGRSNLRGLIGSAAQKGVVAVHPGASSAAKCWPIHRFAELIRAIRKRRAVLLILGPVELERLTTVGLEGLKEPANGVVMNLPLEELAAVLACCVGYVGNDNGISHLAGCLGVPTLALFGSTRAEVWQPLGPRVETIQASELSKLPVEPVLERLKVLLG